MDGNTAGVKLLLRDRAWAFFFILVDEILIFQRGVMSSPFLFLVFSTFSLLL